MREVASLQQISPQSIDKNPDNPRLVFREDEMRALQESIREVGIKVPLSVYADGDRFVLIDGERRWRSALRLNLPAVPALVQPKPGPLENLLTMFNIHNVRVDWDLMPMALKLDRVRQLLQADGRRAGVTELAGATGVPTATVRRALELLTLPMKYQDELLAEAAKPRDQQKVTADLFVEINKARNAIRRYAPEAFIDVPEPIFVDAMVNKYRKGVVTNVVTFRNLSRIARAERAGGDARAIVPIVRRLVRDDDYSVDAAYAATVQPDYESRDIATRAGGLAERLIEVRRVAELSEEAVGQLRRLANEIRRLVGE